LAALLGLAVLTIAVLACWYLARRRCEPLLVEARGWLRAAVVQEPGARAQALQRAEPLLRAYLARGGERTDTAELLLCGLLTLRSYGNLDQRIGDSSEIENLLNKVRPSACATEDLLTAIAAFRQTRKTAQADWLVGAALKRSPETPDHSRVLRLAAAIRYELGQEEAVLAHCEELTKIDPADPEPWRLLAMVYEDGGYTEKLMQALLKVIELDRGDVSEARLKLIDSAIKVGDRDQARGQFARLREQAPQRLAEHPLTEANLLLLEGCPGEALSILERVLAEDPQDAEAIVLRSKLHLSANEVDEAIRLAEALLQLQPMHPEAHYVVGQAYARRGDRDRAQLHLQRHRQILDTRVRLHRLERIAGKDPGDVQTRLEIVKLYEQLSLPDLANFWRRAAASAQRGVRDSGAMP
jgi:tetratricopeptide (TPR) repeat protein